MNLIINNLENSPIIVDSVTETIRKDAVDGLVKELTITTTQATLDKLQTIFTPTASIQNIQIFNTNNTSIYTSTQYTDYPNISNTITDINNSIYMCFRLKIQ